MNSRISNSNSNTNTRNLNLPFGYLELQRFMQPFVLPQAALKPTFQAMPKNEHGNLDDAASRQDEGFRR